MLRNLDSQSPDAYVMLRTWARPGEFIETPLTRLELTNEQKKTSSFLLQVGGESAWREFFSLEQRVEHKH